MWLDKNCSFCLDYHSFSCHLQLSDSKLNFASEGVLSEVETRTYSSSVPGTFLGMILYEPSTHWSMRHSCSSAPVN